MSVHRYQASAPMVSVGIPLEVSHAHVIQALLLMLEASYVQVIEIDKIMRFWQLLHMDLDARKPVFNPHLCSLISAFVSLSNILFRKYKVCVNDTLTYKYTGSDNKHRCL